MDRMKDNSVCRVCVLVLSFFVLSSARTYYVDNRTGNDGANGTDASTPWKTLAKVNATTFGADTVLFACGSIWNDTLVPKAAGTASHPFVISKYGTGNLPLINGGGRPNAIHFFNQEYFEISNLEVTNIAIPNQTDRRGVAIEYRGFGRTIHNIIVRDMYIHDIHGNSAGQRVYYYSGGIWVVVWDGSPFDGLLIERNRMLKVNGQGFMKYNSGGRTPSTNVIVRNNAMDSIGGDGILLYAAKKAVVENNLLHLGGWQTEGGCCAGMWGEEGTDSCVWQYNEVYNFGPQGGCDKQAFDSDFNDYHAFFQYNYSHNNRGGFFLFVPSSSGCTIRYNISQNDINDIPGGGWGLLVNFNTNWPNPGSVVDGTEQIYNNVFVQPQNSGVQFCEKEYVPQNVFNNIFVNISMNSVRGANNCFFNSGNATDNGNIVGNPNFVGTPGTAGNGLAAASIYRLQAGSPCIGKGKLITGKGSLDYFGNPLPANGPIDIGIHQYSNQVNTRSDMAHGKSAQPVTILRNASGTQIKLSDWTREVRILELSGALVARLHADGRQSITIPRTRSAQTVYLIEIDGRNQRSALPVAIW